MTDEAIEQELSKLHGIVLPEPVGLWPPAPGWWLLLVIFVAVAVWLTVVARRRRRRDRYRVLALRELEGIRSRLGALGESSEQRPRVLAEIPELVKRAALECWERDRVASLTGDAWLTELDASYGGNAFREGPGRLLPVIAYATPRELANVGQDDIDALLGLLGVWIRGHRVRV